MPVCAPVRERGELVGGGAVEEHGEDTLGEVVELVEEQGVWAGVQGALAEVDDVVRFRLRGAV